MKDKKEFGKLLPVAYGIMIAFVVIVATIIGIKDTIFVFGVAITALSLTIYVASVIQSILSDIVGKKDE